MPSRTADGISKVKVLFLAADPRSPDAGRSRGTPHPRLRIDEELREIGDKVRAAEYRDLLEFTPQLAVRADDLLQALNRFRPQVVHFSGHGSAAGEILVEGKHGASHAISPGALGSLFRTLKDDIRVVVLNACYTEAQARGIVGVIDCAIGMRREFSDEAAITFAASFYRALGFGRSVQDAFDQGTAALQLEDIREHGTPRLLVREGVDPARVFLVNGSGAHPPGGEREAVPVHPPVSPGADPDAGSAARARDLYLEDLIADHGRISFPAFGGDLRPTAVDLEKLFVGLRGEISTRPQRVAAGRDAAVLREQAGFDEARYLAGRRHARETRTPQEARSERASLNFAQAVRAVASIDFRLVILGDPGSGKTTIARWLAIHMAAALRDGHPHLSIQRSDVFAEEKDQAGAPVVIPGTRLPVLVRVSEYAEFLLGRDALDDGADLHAYVTGRVLQAVSPGAHRAALRRYLEAMDREGRLLVILDGLDELPDAAHAHHGLGLPRWKERIRDTVLEQIRGLAQAFRPGVDGAGVPLPRNALLVTSRIKGYDFNSLLPGELTHFTIEPMRGAERREFFRHWTGAVVAGGADQALGPSAERFCDVLRREVDADPRLSREVTTPQIAGLVASVALSSWRVLPEQERGDPERLGRVLPKSRTEIYGHAVDLLLERWQHERSWAPGTTDEALGRLVRERGQLLRVLKEVALAIHEDRELQTGDVDERRLGRIVEEVAKRLRIPWEGVCDTVETFTRFMIPLLAQHSGFLVQRAHRVFAFQHRSIQEYLAGRLLAEGNAADGTREGDWARLRGFLRSPQQLIQWREVTWHGLAHLQLLDPAGFRRLAAESLAAEVSEAPPFPVTLLLLLEAAPTLPRPEDPEFVQLLARHVLVAFSRDAHLREPLWPAFRAALLRLPPQLVSTGLTVALEEIGAGVAAGAAEILVRLGAIRPLTEWVSPAMVELLVRARHVDDEALGWPVHRCLALVLTAMEDSDLLDQVAELGADRGRARLAHPACQAALQREAVFARRTLALTACIDYRDSVYLSQYRLFEKFLVLDDGVRDAWLPFLQDYWGEGDAIYGIAVHMDSDFGRASAQARVPPSLGWRYALSVNPRLSPEVFDFPDGEPGWGTRLRSLGQYFLTMNNEERYLLLVAESGADVTGLSTQARNPAFIRLLRQRAALLEDGIHRGTPALFGLLQRTGVQTADTRTAVSFWRIALKAVVRALSTVNPVNVAVLPQRFPYLRQDGAALAEWWVFACNGLLLEETSARNLTQDGAAVLERYGAALARDRSWLHAACELATAGALSNRQNAAAVSVEWFYPQPPENLGPDDVPFHALTVFSRSPWHAVPLTRPLVEALLSRVETELPALAAECRAIRWMVGGPGPGSTRCIADDALIGFEERILQTTAEMESPLHRARFLVRMLPYAPEDDLARVRAALTAAVDAIVDPHARLLVLEQLHRATLELFLDEKADWNAAVEVRRQWEAALSAVTDPVHRSLAVARAVFASEFGERVGLILQAVRSAGEVADPLLAAETLRELLPLAELVPAAHRSFEKRVKAIESPTCRDWARGRDSGAFRQLAGKALPETPEFAAFCALHTRVLLEEALLAMGADHGPNAAQLWTRYLRREAPVGPLLALGRLEAFDLTPIVGLTIDERLGEGAVGEVLELLPLCVNPAPQMLPFAVRWAAHADPGVARYGKLICAEILGHVPRRWLGDWVELVELRDDRTRYRAVQCIRHPLVTPQWRRQRFSRLGVRYLLAWGQAVRAAQARGRVGVNDLYWFAQDFVADSRGGLQALVDAARVEDETAENARRIIRSLKVLDAPSWECLLQNLAGETEPAMQHTLLRLVFFAAYNNTVTEERFRGIREALAAPALAELVARPHFVPGSGDYLAVFQELWEAGGGAPVRREAFIAAIEARCPLRVADLVGGTLEDFVAGCRRIAESRHFFNYALVHQLGAQVEIRWAVAALEFFLEWLCEPEPVSGPSDDLQGDHRDHLLHVAAAISAKIPSLIRGNVHLPPGLEPRLWEAAKHASGWPDRVAALELLVSVSSAGPELLECLVRAVKDTAPVRATAFRVLARLRDVNHGFIQDVIERLDDESGVVAYAMGRVLKNAYLHGETTPEDRELIIRALTRAKDSEGARRTVWFEHHSRTNLPQLPRLDQHFARLLAEIWLGDQATTLQQSQSGWTGWPATPP